MELEQAIIGVERVPVADIRPGDLLVYNKFDKGFTLVVSTVRTGVEEHIIRQLFLSPEGTPWVLESDARHPKWCIRYMRVE